MTNEAMLLDSHMLVRFDHGTPISSQAWFAMGEARRARRLYVSDLSVWELGVAGLKRNFERRPDLRGLPLEIWFREVVTRLGARMIRISAPIALEASRVPPIYGSGDPGDCFLIASARIRRLPLITRDEKILRLAERLPDYLDVVAG